MTPNTAASAVGWLAVIGAVGAAVMSLAHWDVPMPLVDDVGRVVAPVAVALGIGAVLYVAVAFGSFRRMRWAWPLGLVVNGLALLSTVAPPFRGPVELVAIVVSGAALALLLSRPGRSAFREEPVGP
jgi:hypothetical protein